MAFGSQPLDGSTPAIPTSSVYVEDDGFYTLRGSSKHTDGSGNVSALADMAVVAALPTGTNSIGQVTANAGTNLNTSALAVESGGNLATLAGAVSSSKMATKAASGDFADGALATLGVKADTAITDSTTTNSTQSFIKGIVKILADIWDSTNHLIHQNIKQVGGTAIDTNSGSKSGGTQRVVLATDQPQLTNALKVDGSAVTQPVSGTVTTNEAAVTSGGTTPFHALSGASNNATVAKNSAGQLYGISISNNITTARFFKLYDKATTPAPATDNGILKQTFMIPGNSLVIRVFPKGMVFSSGISFAAVANISDTDNTSIAASDLSIDLDYK